LKFGAKEKPDIQIRFFVKLECLQFLFNADVPDF